MFVSVRLNGVGVNDKRVIIDRMDRLMLEMAYDLGGNAYAPPGRGNGESEELIVYTVRTD